jgi:hypothetical protein
MSERSDQLEERSSREEQGAAGWGRYDQGGYQRTVFSVCAEKTTLNGPAPQRALRATQATRGIACPKPSEEPQVSTFVPRGALCALRRHLLAGQVLFESKNLTVNPFKTGFERRIEDFS